MLAPQLLSEGLSLEPSRERFLAWLGQLSPDQDAGNFFLSPAWAHEYFSRWPPGDFFAGIRVYAPSIAGHGVVLAAVALSRGPGSSPLSRHHRSLGFNESSSRELADVTTEVNGLIGSAELRFADWIAEILGLLQGLDGWDEMRVNSLSGPEAKAIATAANELGLISHACTQDETYWVDLGQIRGQFGGNYLASRSANTRAQLRRALKALQREHGRFELVAASSADEGHRWLDALAELHKKRWNSHGERKGFANAPFGQFHHELCAGLIEKGQIEVLRARAGDEVLAYLYNYVSGGRVYFSMSGVEHERFSNFKPGLLAHWQAIERYLAQGLRIYDFQTGTGRYKQSLSTHREARVGILVRQPLLKFRLEALARWVKRVLVPARARAVRDEAA